MIAALGQEAKDDWLDRRYELAILESSPKLLPRLLPIRRAGYSQVGDMGTSMLPDRADFRRRRRFFFFAWFRVDNDDDWGNIILEFAFMRGLARLKNPTRA